MERERKRQLCHGTDGQQPRGAKLCELFGFYFMLASHIIIHTNASTVWVSLRANTHVCICDTLVCVLPITGANSEMSIDDLVGIPARRRAFSDSSILLDSRGNRGYLTQEKASFFCKSASPPSLFLRILFSFCRNSRFFPFWKIARRMNLNEETVFEKWRFLERISILWLKLILETKMY